MLAVTGANGTGKSTVLKILSGILRPAAGTVRLRVNGQLVMPEARPLHIGCVMPHVNVYEDLTARENLHFIAQVRGLAKSGMRIQEALEAVSLTARANERVHTFSSGMKQRMKIAAAVLVSPPVLMLDEPTVNMDARGRTLCADLVAGAKARGCIVVVASNVAADCQGADKVVCVEDYAR